MQEFKLNQSTEERVRNTTERVENIVQKVEDINQKANMQISTIQVLINLILFIMLYKNLTSHLQSLEFRLRKMEDTTGQIMSHLAVIHRFMSQHTTPPPLAPHAPQHLHQSASELDKMTGALEVERLRRASERSDEIDVITIAPVIPTTLGLGNVRRRPVVRSLTEVRPDAYIFDDGRIEVKPLHEEDEDMLEEDTEIKHRFIQSPVPSQHHLQSVRTLSLFLFLLYIFKSLFL